jgi:uncharacterized membrane-anchored protein YhcB (DUF1043 family)
MNQLIRGIQDSKEGKIMSAWAALFFGVCVGILLTFLILFLEFTKKENNKTQELRNEVQSTIDGMSPRDLYINKISQNNLVWDRTTYSYINKWSDNERKNH